MTKLNHILGLPLICWIFLLSFTICHGASRISNNYNYNYGSVQSQRKPSSALKEEVPSQRCSKGSQKRIPDENNPNKFYMCTYNNAHHIWMVYSFSCPTDTVFDKPTQKCITKEKQEANLQKQSTYVGPNRIKLVPNSHTIISDKNTSTNPKPSRKTNPNSNSKITATTIRTAQKTNQINLNYPIRIITPTSSSGSGSGSNNVQRVGSTTRPYVRFTNRPTIPSRISSGTKNRYPQNQNQPTTVRIPSRFPVPYARRTTTTTSTTEAPTTTTTTTTTESPSTTTTEFLPVKSSSESSSSSVENQSSNGSEHLGVIKMITGKISYLAQAIDALLNVVESTMKSNAELCTDEKDRVQIRPNLENQNQKQDNDETSQLISPAQSNFNIFDFFKYTPLNLNYNTINETISRISSSTESTLATTTSASSTTSTTEKIQIVHPTSSSNVDFVYTNEENVSEEQEQEDEQEEASEEEENEEVVANKNNDITQATSISSSSTFGNFGSSSPTENSVEWNVFLNENNKKQQQQSQTETNTYTDAEKASVASPTTTFTNVNDSGVSVSTLVLESSTKGTVGVRIPGEKRVQSQVPLNIPANLMFPSSSLASASPTKSSQDIIDSLESISKVKVGHRRPRREASNLL